MIMHTQRISFRKKTNRILLGICLLTVSIENLAFSGQECYSFAKNQFEKIYCQIMAEGEGKNLPDFYSFQKSHPKTQRLLIKREAEKLGIILPEITHSSTTKKHTKKNKTINSQVVNQQVRSSISSHDQSLMKCSLKKQFIHCDKKVFELAENSPNHILGTKSLPKITASSNDRRALTATYKGYIRNMLMLGLGDSTMSYTKFVSIYDETNRQNQNFSDRLNTMFAYLKEERQQNGIKKRYNNNYPNSIKACMHLSNTLIVCDNVIQNWVYVLKN